MPPNDIKKEYKCIGINCITNNYSLDFRVSHGILIDFVISPEEEAKVNRTRQEMEKKDEKKVTNIILCSFKFNVI